jgi:hypothetical protein
VLRVSEAAFIQGNLMSLSVEFRHRPISNPKGPVSPSKGPDVEFGLGSTGNRTHGTFNGVSYEAQSLSLNGKWARFALLALGSMALAYVLRRSSVSLNGSLCLFLGVMPIWWIISSLVGLFFSMKKVANDAKPENGDGELLRLTLHETFEIASVSEKNRPPRQIRYAQMTFRREGTEAFISLKQEAPLVVPASAFESDKAFDEFCLELQRNIWAAERGGST